MAIINDQIQVEVLGEVFSIRDNSGGEEVRKTSEYLNTQIDILKERYPSLTAKKLAVLAAFHLTDELMQVRKDYETLAQILDKQ